MRHPGLFLSTLLTLGVLPSLPAPRSQEDLDREDDEREAAALKARSAAYQAALAAGMMRPEAIAAALAADEAEWRRERHNPYTGEREFDEQREKALRGSVWASTSQGAMSGKTHFAESYAREAATREAHRARVAPVLAAARAAEGPRTLQGLRWSMNYIERKGTRWNIQFGRVGEGHCAWLTNAATDVRMPRDAFERKHFDDKDPDFSGFDTRAELEAAIKKWAQTPERDRQAQREAKRVRKAVKSRRGW